MSLNAHATDDIAVMGLIKDKAILRVDGAHISLNKGEVSKAGIKLVDIGENRKSIILNINGEIKRYKLGHGTRTAIATVKIPSDSTGIYKTTGKINNTPVSYIVDTGATLVSLNSNIAAELGIDYQSTSKKARAETANGLISVYLVTLDSVEVGTIKINNVEAAVHEGEFPKTVLLGMSFLKQLNIEREGDILSLQLK